MMEWSVLKTGAAMFDWLHSCGLGIFLAHVFDETICLENEGHRYRLWCKKQCQVTPSAQLFDKLIHIPDDITLFCQDLSHLREEDKLIASHIDGLLATLLTSPGSIRTYSLADLNEKYLLDPSTVLRGAVKLQKAVQEWKDWLIVEVGGDITLWAEQLLREYDIQHPYHPIPSAKTADNAMTIKMTLDPSLGYALRKPRSDGTVAAKTNIMISGTRFAALLASIGAMRFLRAQKVAGNQVNYYVPIANKIFLNKETTLPLLPLQSQMNYRQALLANWLTYVLANPIEDTIWQQLAFQSLQIQRLQAPISYQHGNLDVCWLEQLKSNAGSALLKHWEFLLRCSQKHLPFERDSLEEALFSQNIQAWMCHVQVTADATYTAQKEQTIRAYSFNEMKEVVTMVETSPSVPFRPLLERERGTLCFGRALRLLKQSYPSSAKDVYEELEHTQTRDQFIEVMSHLTQQCAVAEGRTKFIIIPSETDFLYLSDDLDLYGVRSIANVLRVLSSLRYPSDPGRAEARTLWRLLEAVLASYMLLAYDTRAMQQDSENEDPLDI